MKFNNYVWALYLIIFPFQFFKEGDPQITDILGVLLIATNFKTILLSIKTNAFTKFLFLFVLYTILVNTIWMLILSNILIIKSSLYYLYSFFLFLFVASKIKDKVFLNFTQNAIAISLGIQFIFYPFMPDQGERAIMFFNQTNQLAFWAISVAVISIIIHYITKTKNTIFIGILVLSTFFIAITGSRSAVIGILLFWGFYFIKSAKQIIFLIAFLTVFLTVNTITDGIDLKKIPAVSFFMERLEHESISSGNQGLDDRGYDRILEFPQYLLFGSGEGDNWRFNQRIEIHSTPLNVLFSYGIIGFSLFGLALWLIIKRPDKEIYVLLVIYGITAAVHMTLRLPLFWITLLFLYALSEHKNQPDNLELVTK